MRTTIELDAKTLVKNILDLEWIERTIAEDKATGADVSEIAKTIQDVARWYDETPSVINAETKAIYRTFCEECSDQAKRLVGVFNVKVERVTGQPYLTPSEMFEAIRHGILKISTDNVKHPLMDLDATVDLRVWHDLTHFELQSNFGFTGEYKTYQRQVMHTKSSTRNHQYLDHALYSDIVGQVANGIIHRAFPIQKVFTIGGYHE